LSGPAKRKYFRDALRADPGVSPEAAQRLTEKFDADLSHMRVRQHASLQAKAALEQSVADAAAAPAKSVQPAAKTASAAKPTPPPTAAASFDPHAFSVIVVMTRQGADGLKRKLETIESPEHLRALARAQHIAIDSSLEQPAALRAAIVAGTAQRIADRRAAAS
jgi:hypothetical protein